MKNTISKLVSNKLVCGIGITMTLAGILILTAQMFPKIKLAEEKSDFIKISKVKIIDTNLLAKIDNSNETKETTSRSSDEVRTNRTKEADNTEELKTQETNKTEKVEIKEDTTNYTSIDEVKISRDMDLSVRTGLSREDFIKLIAGVKYDTSGFFEENAGKIYDFCEKYSINEIFFCGLISAESAWNIASNHRRTYNYISMMSNGRLIQFGSVDEGLEAAAKLLHNKYLTKGGAFYHGKTLSGVQKCFCPSDTWVDLVYGRMKQVLN